MFILYTGQFFEAQTACERAKRGGRRVRSLASKIQTTGSNTGLALIYFALVRMGDNLTAETVAQKGVRLGFWADVPTEGRDFEVRASGREYGSARLSDYLGVSQEARLSEVRAAAASAQEAQGETVSLDHPNRPAQGEGETGEGETGEGESAQGEGETVKAGKAGK